MAQVKPFCVFCKKKTGKLIVFSTDTMQKCRIILDIRQANTLAMSDAKVPSETNDFQLYHSKCYKLFTALPSKYRKFITPTASNFTEEASTSGYSYEDITVHLEEESVVKAEIDDAQIEEDGNWEITMEDDSHSECADKFSEHVCIFCLKKRKKRNGREQQLQSRITEDSLNNLQSTANEMGDEQLINRITELSARNEVILYHKICKLNYTNLLQSKLTSEAEKTQWHVTRDIHKLAFENVCSFISENIIERSQSYFLDFLKSLFVEFASNLDPNVLIHAAPYNFECRLLNTFTKKISVVTMKGKKIVKPYNAILVRSDFDVLEEKDILDRATLILRKRIRNIKHRRLPDDSTTDTSFEGECEVPQQLINYYSKIISTKYPAEMSTNVQRLAKSFSQDLIYAATNGRIKTSKHINLGMTVKSLTNSKQVIDILNEYGHCCSYTVLEELETKATFAATRQSNICPVDVIPSNNLRTGLAFDNFDRSVDSATGKDPLHVSVGKVFQNIVDSQHSIPRNDVIAENLDESESSTSSVKRRRSSDMKSVGLGAAGITCKDS